MSLVYTEHANASSTINVRVNNGTNDIFIVAGQSVAAYGTFVWNDRIVLEEDDDIDVYNSSTDGHWWISYIDQDWT